MTRPALAFAVLMVLAAGSPAQAKSPEFAQMERICLASNAVAAEAIKRAQAEGFEVSSDEAARQELARQGLVRATPLAKAERSMFVGAEDNFNGMGGIKLDVCSLSLGGDPATVDADLRAWAGVPPAVDRPDALSFTFIVDPDGSHRRIVDVPMADRPALFRQGVVATLSVFHTPDGPLMFYGFLRAMP